MFPARNGRAELSTRPLRKPYLPLSARGSGVPARQCPRDARATGEPAIGIGRGGGKDPAESPLFHGQLKILIGGRDHAHVDGDFPISTQAVIRLAIQHAEQFHLDLRLQLADFVRKIVLLSPAQTSRALRSRRH